MSAARKYAVIDPATGKLDRRIFSDQAVYDDEMDKIFGRGTTPGEVASYLVHALARADEGVA